MRRDRGTFRRAIELSLLLHLVILLLVVPGLKEVWPSTTPLAQRMAVRPPPEDRQPLEFELVDLPDQREEAPAREDVPLSDLDRRAHGGEGEAAARPGVRGTTRQLVQSEGGDQLGRAAPPRQPVPQPAPEEPQPPRETSGEARRQPADEGRGEEAAPVPTPRPSIRLPESGAWQLPPELGGLPEAPDREGGSVDAGALSFDTQWYDWGPYAAGMLRKIRKNWNIPQLARLGVKGVVRIRFYIGRDGTMSGLQILDESGKPPMDFAARDAIVNASPFAPLPADLPGGDREGVTITFFYNTRPEDRAGSR